MCFHYFIFFLDKVFNKESQAQGLDGILFLFTYVGLIQDRIRICKIKGVILTGVWSLLRTPVSVVLTTSARHLALAKRHFPLTQ